MFVGGNFYWYLMGALAVLAGFGFKYFCEDRGWELNWWKWLLTIIWYGMVNLSFLSWGTLIGEMEATAGWRLGVFGLVVCLILGVGLWRLLASKPKAT